MLLVPTEIRSSKIHGTGLFLLQPIKKDELIWRFDSRIDHVVTETVVLTLPTHTQDFIRSRGCWHQETKLWMLFGDLFRHTNHSEQPNLQSMGPAFGNIIALADLASDTELTVNYYIMCDKMRLTGQFYKASQV